jgi:hypothetical protein
MDLFILGCIIGSTVNELNEDNQSKITSTVDEYYYNDVDNYDPLAGMFDSSSDY